MSTTRCPHCGSDIQRTPEGKLIDGMNAHLRIVHQLPPRQRAATSTTTKVSKGRS